MSYMLADWQSGVRPPKGWDCADAFGDGWTADDYTKMMREAVCDDLPAWTYHIDLRDKDAWLERAIARAAGNEPPAPEPEPEPQDPPPTMYDFQPPVEADERQPLAQMIEDWCFVAGRASFRHLHTGSEVKVQSFNLIHQRHTPEVDYTVSGRVLKTPREVSASDYLMSYASGRWVQDTMYLPQQADAGPVVTVEGVAYLNSYLPRYVPRAADVWQGHWSVEVWERHLQNILPVDWRLLLTWMAYNTQNPGKKILWAPIVKGTQGDGKTTLSVLMGCVMGSKNVKVVSTESLFSDFTGYAEGSCVAFFEEIRVKGHNRHDAMNKLKPLVTNSVVDVVRKGSDGRNIPNVTNYMAFTNFEDALVIDENDRRWGVFFTRFQTRAQLLEAGIGKAYWDPLYEAAENHADVLRAWLLSVDVSEFDPKAAPPITSAKAAMILSSISAEAAMLQEVVSLGRLGVGHHAAATDAVNVVLKSEQGQVLATTRMATAFAEIGWQQYGQIKWSGRTRRVYIDGKYPWPVGEAQMRAEVRRMLDETEGGAGLVSPLDDVMAAEPEKVGW